MALIGTETLIEAIFTTNGPPPAILYGKPGVACIAGARRELDLSGAWSTFWQGALGDLFRELPVAVPAERPLFLRAWRKP